MKQFKDIFLETLTETNTDGKFGVVLLGGDRIDFIDGFLNDFYRKFGFREYDRMKWDDKYAPDGWDYKRFGRPDIIFARL